MWFNAKQVLGGLHATFATFTTDAFREAPRDLALTIRFVTSRMNN